MKILYEATATDEDTGRVLARIFSYSPEGLEGKLGTLDQVVNDILATEALEDNQDLEPIDDEVVGNGSEKETVK
jgi:hypothetical protein